MKIFFPKEANPNETRVAAVPASVAKLVKLGAEVLVEAGLGRAINFSDEEYVAAGAVVEADQTPAWRCRHRPASGQAGLEARSSP